MDVRLHLLDSFAAHGSDGADYKVCAYERMARDVSLPQSDERWEPTGITEYRLADGRMVQVERDGTMQVVGSAVRLTPSTDGSTLH